MGQKPRFSLKPSGVTSQGSIPSDHPVTGQEKGKRIGPDSVSHCPTSPGLSHELGVGAVGSGLAKRNGLKGRADTVMKGTVSVLKGEVLKRKRCLKCPHVSLEIGVQSGLGFLNGAWGA
jgi:hypothetical protein